MNRDDQLQAALWWKGIRETNNRKFLPLFFDKSRYLVLKGGGGSGKSIFVGRKILERVTTEPGHRVLVTRKVGKTLRESCFEQLKGQAHEFYEDQILFIPKGKSSDMYMKFRNGSEIIFAGMDDPEKIKSVYNITMIWMEEASEFDKADFDQLDIRLRTEFPFYLQMLISFNPISITHWLKKRFFDVPDPRARVHESTYKDNRFLTPEAIRTLEAFRETDEYYYMVYCLGQWGVTGKTIFDGKKITARLVQVQKTGWKKRGVFLYDLAEDGIHISNIRWQDESSGPIKIYQEPGAGRPYVIGGDTAGDGSDWFVGQALDNITGKQVAVLRHQYEEAEYSRQMYCLGKYYNDALEGPETNFSTYPVKLLQLMGYQKLFVRQIEDSFDGSIRHSFGFRTDQITRPVIISDLQRLMDLHPELINDEDTLLEMLTFIRNDKMRPEAEPGAHDDCIMALAIAYYIRQQQIMTISAGGSGRDPMSGWTADMIEDYRNASPEMQARMRQLWGKE